MSLKDSLIALRNKLLKKKGQVSNKPIDFEKIQQEHLKKKNKHCDLLIKELEELEKPVYVTPENEEVAISDETKAGFISILREYKAHDSTRYTIFSEDVMDSTVSYYLDYDGTGINLTYKSYDYPIAAAYHEHYKEPVEMLYRYSKLDIAEKKDSKGSSKK